MSSEDATLVNQPIKATFYLRGVSPQVSDKVFPLSNNTRFGNTLLGRGQDCHIVIDEQGVSRQHAAFHVEESQVLVEDLNSSNGTYINNVEISKAELKPGDLIAFNDLQFKLEVMGGVVRAPERSKAARPEPAPEPNLPPEEAGGSRWWLYVIALVLIALAGLIGYSLG